MSRSCPRPPFPTRRAAQLFHALSDETRLEIVRLLSHGERCVCELQSVPRCGAITPVLPLKTLKDAGLVSDRRDGRWIYYALNRDALDEIAEFASGVKPGRQPGAARRPAASEETWSYGRRRGQADSEAEVRTGCARRGRRGAGKLCGASSCGCDPVSSNLYDPAETATLPAGAVLASLGCGNPTALASSTRVRWCSTWGPEAASMSCYPPGAWGRPERPTVST